MVMNTMLVTVCLFVWTMRKMICGLQKWRVFGKINIWKSGSKEDGFIQLLMPVHTVAMGKVGLSMVVIGLMQTLSMNCSKVTMSMRIQSIAWKEKPRL